MHRQRQIPSGERRVTRAVATSLLLLAALMPNSSTLAADRLPADQASSKEKEVQQGKGWFSKLFSKDASDDQGGGPDAPPASLAARKSVAPNDDEAEGTPEALRNPVRQTSKIGKVLAGFFRLDEEKKAPLRRETKELPSQKLSGSPDSRIDKFVVTEDGTPLYADGPLQVQPVDIKLDAGVIVSVVKWRKGWSDIRLETGDFGTVATDVLRKANASDFPVEELAIRDRPTGEGEYVEAVLPDMLPLLAPVVLPDYSSGDGVEASPLELNPLLLPPLPE